MAKTSHNLVFPMLNRAPAWKKYTTAGRGGCDKYELCGKALKEFYTSAAREGPDKFQVW